MRHMRVELPPIVEAWRESSVFGPHLGAKAGWMPRRMKQECLRRLLLSTRALVSLEEVHGAGLLKRYLDAKLPAHLRDAGFSDVPKGDKHG